MPLVASAKETEKVTLLVPIYAKGKTVRWEKTTITRPKEAKPKHPNYPNNRKLPFLFEGKEYHYLLVKN